MRAFRSAAFLGLATRVFTGPDLVKIYVALGRRLVRILFGDFEHLVELLAEDVGVRLVALHRFEKRILAPAGFAALPLDRALEVGEGRRLHMIHVPDHRAGIRIDVQLCFATRASNFDEWRVFRHAPSVY